MSSHRLASRNGAGGHFSEQDGTIAFRVRIGVTGHRHISDHKHIEAAVADRLDEIRKTFAPTRSAPVVFSVLSALAEGADRLVVKVALDHESEMDAELGAVLPLPVEDYMSDFKSVSSQHEFRDLLSRASASIGLQQEHSPEPGKRDEAYDRAGRYIVDHSDVLIAVWDGLESQGHVGTADTVEYAHECGVPVLVVPASNIGVEDSPPIEDVSFRRESIRRKATRDALRRIDRYNKVSLRSSHAREGISAERARLGRSLENSSMHGRFMLVADWALPHMARADKLAVLNQRYHWALAWTIHLLAALAVTNVAVQTLFFYHEPIWLIGEIFLLVMLLLAVAIGRHVRLQDRWIGYRSLAEGFRSGLFFALSDGEYRRRTEGVEVLGEPEEDWFQRAFSQAWRFCPEVALERGDAAPLRNFLAEAWIDDQIDYHRHTAKHWKALHNLYTVVIGLLAVVTITVAVLHISHVGEKSWVGDALRLCALTLPAFGGAVAGIREYGQLRLHEERSKRAIQRLGALKNRLAVSSSLSAVRQVATDAQRVMVDETLDWSGVVEFQDPDFVI